MPPAPLNMQPVWLPLLAHLVPRSPVGSKPSTPSSELAPQILNQNHSKMGVLGEASNEPFKVRHYLSHRVPVEREQRSRERNRIHARKTRQRKKEQMQNLQQRADELKQEQLCLKQIINEKNTASILVGLFATSSTKSPEGDAAEDPRVEALLRRSVEDIPDASQIPELPALILPGQHASRKARAEAKSKDPEVPEDGIDYNLLGKDRSKCSPEELDQIRRERNRMHAKRTRDRKRMFMEEMGEMCRQLEDENDLLLHHLKTIDPDYDVAKLPKRTQVVPPEGPAVLSPKGASGQLLAPAVDISANPSKGPSKVIPCNNLNTLLEVAGSFEKKQPNHHHVSALFSIATSISAASDSDSSSMASEVRNRPAKRLRTK